MSDPDATAAELVAAFPELRAPREVVDAAKGLLTWRTIDSELAALTFDSLLDDEQAAVRSGHGPRALAFESEDLEIEIEVLPSADRRRLVGRLAPPTPADVDVVVGDRTVTVPADELGRFAVDLPEARVPVALAVRVPGSDPVRTAPLAI
ncbi:hypothetical protein GCM10023215_49660 [Pseudonocardia yuanmonensis]|uniref:Uncharacterized protein n=1 Tax=Pseudonocardia yuanmonensis TaxID=1095914 RepID=A0ABP8XAC7_9PSEU